MLQNASPGLQGIIDHVDWSEQSSAFTGNAAIGVSWQIVLR
jgi:hypothetical protein